MNEYIVIGIVAFAVLVTYFIVNHFKFKNVESVADTVDKVTDIIEEIVEMFNFSPTNEKKIVQILDIVDYTATEVGKIIDANKAEEVHAVIKEVLDKVGYTPNQNEQGLINIVIDEALRFITKK